MNGQDILTDAYAKNKKNQPERIATEATELLGVVNRVVRTMFMIGVRVNPYFYGTSASVAFSSPGWARPTIAESVFRLEVDPATEVVVVPFDELDAEPTSPAVYSYGQIYRTAGNALDPTSGPLTIFYSSRPAVLPDLTTEIDTRFPEAYKELLILETAIYLAIKDEREEEVSAHAGDRDAWLVMLLGFMEHETIVSRGRFEPRPFRTETVIPIASLLAGGTGVELP